MKDGDGMNKISAEKNILSYALNKKIRSGFFVLLCAKKYIVFSRLFCVFALNGLFYLY